MYCWIPLGIDVADCGREGGCFPCTMLLSMHSPCVPTIWPKAAPRDMPAEGQCRSDAGRRSSRVRQGRGMQPAHEGFYTPCTDCMRC